MEENNGYLHNFCNAQFCEKSNLRRSVCIARDGVEYVDDGQEDEKT